MSLSSPAPDPLAIASTLSPVLFALGDPDLLVELLSSNPAGIALVEANGELSVVYCNDSFSRCLPIRQRPIVGRSMPELVAWTDPGAVRAACNQVIATGRPLHWTASAECDGPKAEGGLRCGFWHVSHYPVRGPTGKVSHVLTFCMDVSDRVYVQRRMKDAEQEVLAALRVASQRLEASGDMADFFGELTGAVAGLTSASRVAFWKQESGREAVSPQPGTFGFSDDELALLQTIPCSAGSDGAIDGVVFRDQVLRDHRWRGGAYAARLGALGIEDGITIPWKAGDRSLGALAAYGSNRSCGFSDEDLWVLQLATAAAALVWEHKQADDAVAELREREARSLHQRIEQSIELEQLKTDFLKLASHELRAPISVVRGYLSMIEDGTFGEVGDTIASVLPLLRGKLEEMNQLVNEMLETARLEDSALQLHRVPMDLRDAVSEAVRALEPLLTERHRLMVTMSEDAVPVHGDRARLTMIVTNLVHNAIKYSPRGGGITVTCRLDGDLARVSVSDQGVGLAPKDMQRLFTRFRRIVTNETRNIPGIGLGLYLARDLARRHGGDVEVVSELNRGSTFTLSLPRA